jgi:hypothetical protein
VTYAHYIRKLFTALFNERDRPTPAKAPLEESYFMNDVFAGVRCLIFMNVLTSIRGLRIVRAAMRKVAPLELARSGADIKQWLYAARPPTAQGNSCRNTLGRKLAHHCHWGMSLIGS